MRRREFLKLGVAGVAGAAGIRLAPHHAGSGEGGAGEGGSGDRAPVVPVVADPARTGGSRPRSLVVIELSGGNDGLNTVVPMESDRYRDLRPATFIAPADLHRFDAGFGLHPALTRLSGRGVAVVAGVGVAEPDGSHFEMANRWWMGDPDGHAAPRDGFLGRLADMVGDPGAPAVAVGLGGGSAATLAASKVTTMSLDDLDAVDLFETKPDDRMLTAFQHGFEALSRPGAFRPGGGGSLLAAEAASGMRRATTTARLLSTSAGAAMDLPGGDLGKALGEAARLLGLDVGVRILHVSMGGFDTHSDHRDQHNRLLGELDLAVDAFLAELDRRGLGSSTLVATTSEFGRRARDNGSDGLDHGAASVALLAGPVHAGMHGEQPRLDRLDDDDNLRATVDLGSYYATLASWLGVDPADVLPRGAKALSNVLRT